MSVLVAGTIAIDDVKTPAEEHKDLLGGSASYASISSSFFAPTSLQGIIGKDFPPEHLALFKKRGIDVSGVERADGDTFRWSGEYFDDLNQRQTLSVQLNVINGYEPKVPENLADSRIVLLANESPMGQITVLEQCKNPAFVIADTMDLWIETTRDALGELLRKIDLLVINDSEAKLLGGTSNLITAGHRLRELGPDYVVVKKGEHGSMLFSQDHFYTCAAYPLHEVRDPTGAGDTFAGALAGVLAKEMGDSVRFKDICRGAVYGTVMASFVCEAFSTRALEALDDKAIERRYDEFIRYTHLL